MATIETSAPTVNRSLTVEYNYGSNLQEAIALFGEDVVFSAYEDSVTIAIQGLVRRNLCKKDDKYVSAEEIIKKVEAWKPGVIQRSASSGPSMAKIIASYKKMSPEERATFLTQLREQAEGESEE